MDSCVGRKPCENREMSGNGISQLPKKQKKPSGHEKVRRAAPSLLGPLPQIPGDHFHTI